MEFSSSLLGKPSHEALIRLQDYEIKLLEVIKKTILGRIEHDRKYSNMLSQLANHGLKIENSMFQSPIFNAWKEIVHSMLQTSHCIKKSADFMQSSTLDKVTALIKDKTTIRKNYTENRERIDHKFVKTIHTELDKKHSSYMKLETEVAQAHKAYDAAVEKGKFNPIEKAQDKYRKTTMKLHHAHNDYTLQVMEAQLHQHQYRNQVLPELLSGMQHMETECAETLKQALHEFLTYSSPCREELVSCHKEAENAVMNIDSHQEFDSFIQTQRTPLEPEANITYEVMKGEAANLPMGQIVLNNLSMQGVEHIAQGYQEDLEQVQIEIDDLKQTLSGTEEDIRQFSQNLPNLTRFFSSKHIGLISKQLDCTNLKRQLTEQENLQHMLQNLHYHVHHAIQDLGDQDPPVGLYLPELDTISTASSSSSYEPKRTVEGAKNFMLNKVKLNIKNKLKFKDDGVKSPMDQSKTIKEQTWFHGTIPRTESLRLLQQDGDFLLRESNNSLGDFVLSAKADGQVRHFKVQVTDNGMYRFEADQFPTVLNLISHHYQKREPVTKRTNCLLLNPICKDKWQLSHDDFTIDCKIGQGNFGEVYKALFIRENYYVAVKTCKETVDNNTKEKFLMEAKILKGYDHKNIVRLIGVCTDRQPIYIVMEFVSGGDLVKYLKQNQHELCPRHLVQFCHDACMGLAYLEDKKCIHRDVAARNCLVSDDLVVKITDFGMSREEEDGVYSVNGHMKNIPMKWTAPEAMNFGTFTSASDVWSFSILSWEIFNFGALPYPRMTNHSAKERVEKGYRMPQPPECPSSYYTEVMQRCWEYEPKQRPKFAEIVVTIDRIMRTLS
uniref:tyrosine-protein kinase Fer isoform X1 n=1 Tax=Ciona intestinalis TaxID=7719 RepID=UPI000180D3EC|nr:tyrosine-protein kinase Fer isoform X1 [Ciona intestinalis]|eukprot:XP_009858066.1 tyrosine-protein kinase Fer isoform X1 [Ciona intestinalis]